MRAWIGITDWQWFRLLAKQRGLEEINFWQPGGQKRFARLEPGELFLFKLHSPRNFIVGGGVFAYSTLLPVSLAWSSFEIANGASSLEALRSAIEGHRKDPPDRLDYTIGCILLTQPFFLTEDRWIRFEPDWPRSYFGGIRYELTQEPGITLYRRLREALANEIPQVGSAMLIRDLPDEAGLRYGKPVLITPRLGQGSFRVLVTDAYDRRCAITDERVLPVLEAAHIRPYAKQGAHRVENGLLLRSDLHALFDQGYLTVTPDLRVEVSRRIREEFHNGRAYYALRGQSVRAPAQSRHHPAREFLSWHNEQVYRD